MYSYAFLHNGIGQACFVIALKPSQTISALLPMIIKVIHLHEKVVFT